MNILIAKDVIYMKVTKDDLELPIAVADSVEELAEMTGTHRTTIFRGIKKKGSGYEKIETKISSKQLFFVIN